MKTRFTLEHFLYLTLFALALALRLYNLGAHPLTDAEAREALPIFRLLNGDAASAIANASLPTSPAYFFFTYFGFLVFDASDAVARLAPAMLGAALVFVPFLFRKSEEDPIGLEPGAALLASAFIAVSAGLLAASREASGGILALFGVAFGAGALSRALASQKVEWWVAAGISLGIGLASGAAFLTGAVAVLLTLLILNWTSPEDRASLTAIRERLMQTAERQTFGVALALTVFIVSTTATVYLHGLGALAQSWAGWFAGFAPIVASRSPLDLLMFLIAYEPFLLGFGAWGMWQAFRMGHRLGQALTWYALLAFGLSVVRGARQPSDLIWVCLALALLAAYVIADRVAMWWHPSEWALAAIPLGIVIGLWWFASINVATFAEQVRINAPVASAQVVQGDFVVPTSAYFYLTVAGIGVILSVVISLLFGMGWSQEAARLGLMVGVGFALFNTSLSAGWGLTQLRANQPLELWWASPTRATADDVHLLMESLVNLSNFSGRDMHDIEVTVQGDADGVLGWALRDFPYARFVTSLDAGIASPAVITPHSVENPTLGSAYVGQDFALYRTADLKTTWTQWLGWFLFRRAPMQAEQIILWVRQDVQQLQTVGP